MLFVLQQVVRDSEHGIICSSNTWGTKTLQTSYKNPDLSLRGGAAIFVCLVLVFSTLIPEKSRKSEKAKKNYTHIHVCTQTQ